MKSAGAPASKKQSPDVVNTRVYELKTCGTCKKAIRFLQSINRPYTAVPIVDRPPTLDELRQMLKALKSEGRTIKALFNTSGELYRSLGISAKLKSGLSEDEALQLLSRNGKLIKRPFVIGSEGQRVVGFSEDLWKTLF